ncbi:MAG: hypothetical protein MI802_00440 [Desulfobacterales bacterium]|nr:hypothetical protein [Desulfobacterales bacterium]
MKTGLKYIFFLIVVSAALATISSSNAQETSPQTKTSPGTEETPVSKQTGEATSLEMLQSLQRLKDSLKKRMAEKRQLIKKTASETEKTYLEAELQSLDEQLAGAVVDFERIATGVDVGLFAKKKAEHFNWKNELVSLVEPGIMELKRITVKARHKTKLKDQLSSYENLVPVAVKARTRIENLIEKAEDPKLKKELKGLLPEYKGLESQIRNKLDLVRLQLEEIAREETSLIESSQRSVKNFFKNPGTLPAGCRSDLLRGGVHPKAFLPEFYPSDSRIPGQVPALSHQGAGADFPGTHPGGVFAGRGTCLLCL